MGRSIYTQLTKDLSSVVLLIKFQKERESKKQNSMIFSLISHGTIVMSRDPSRILHLSHFPA
jgi:hypothetical protein